MGSEEKKFTLDELPDEGSSSVSGAPEAAPRKAAIKKGSDVDPRKNLISGVSGNEKIRVMEQSWRFDKKNFLFGWLLYAGAIVALQVYVRSPVFSTEWMNFQDASVGVLSFLTAVVLNPILFLFLTPFLFSFREESTTWFEVNFDGISTVRKVHPGKGEFPTRFLVKWADIHAVKKISSHEREILQLDSKEGLLAQLIWDIDMEKKKGFQHLLKSLVPSAHPLRKFLEKELA